MANTENAEFRTVTPHGVVSGGKPKKGVGQGSKCSCPLSVPPLEVIDAFVALTVPGHPHPGRDGLVAATAMRRDEV